MAIVVKQTEDKTEIRCPNCGQWADIGEYRAFTLNPHYVTELTPVLQCHQETERGPCLHIFAPTALALKMRTDMLAGVSQEGE